VRQPAGYSGTPLPKKLGIKAGMTVALIGAPPGFARTLGELPDGAKLRAGARGKPGLVIWFVGSAPELGWEIRRISAFASEAPLWIAWRKKTSPEGSRASRSPGSTGRREASKAGSVDKAPRRAGDAAGAKRSAGPSENAVREAGLAAGLVDYKVCAIDAAWSGLLFARRRDSPT